MSNITSGSSSSGDVYARCKTGSNTAGRGSDAGWTPCPLCNNNSLLLSSKVMNDGGSGISSLAGSGSGVGGLLNIGGKFLRCPLLCMIDCGILKFPMGFVHIMCTFSLQFIYFIGYSDYLRELELKLVL